MPEFSERLIAWQRQHGRHDLPWQENRDAYRIWVAEVMLQQTQVATVIPYFQRFLARFPDLASLAHSPLDGVLEMWSGLGYYSRARNLSRAAGLILSTHGGRFPEAMADVLALPGIGRSTAGAILAAAFGQRHAILDGNVKRVLARHFGIEGFPGESKVERVLWQLSESLLPQRDVAGYHQALMDLGAAVCLRLKPRCAVCPVRTSCAAHAADRTAKLPAPRPKRIRPKRRQTVVILRSRQRVLLVQRAAQGVWGGLWSLPEVEQGTEGAKYFATGANLQVNRVAALPPLRHGFTHFELELCPVLIDVAAPHHAVAEASPAWFDFSALASVALPAPIRRLLREVALAGR